MPMLNRRQFEILYRAHSVLVRRCVRHKQIQEADQQDIAQTVWSQVLKSWPSPPPGNEAAYLKTVARNALHKFWERKFARKRDERRTTALIDEGDSATPTDPRLVESPRVESDVSRALLRGHLDVIVNRLPLEIQVVVRKLRTHYESVPRYDRERAIAALQQAMQLARPRSIERPGEIIEGPSHCGRTARRLRQEDAANDAEMDDEEEDAAE